MYKSEFEKLKKEIERVIDIVENYESGSYHIWAKTNEDGSPDTFSKVVKLWGVVKENGYCVDINTSDNSFFGLTKEEVIDKILFNFYGLSFVKKGLTFYQNINQAERFCEVLDVKNTRFRISFEMSGSKKGGGEWYQEGWRKGIRSGEYLFSNLEDKDALYVND